MSNGTFSTSYLTFLRLAVGRIASRPTHCGVTTCAVSSIAQLCLDPYYRTMDGFRVLVEKEWLAFGHKFSYRTGHTAASQNTALAPFFLQFLDIVHQILIQYPMAFEFNQYYLKFLAYHSMSHRFKTFVFNWELDRVGLSSPSGSGTGDMSWSNTGGSSHRPKLVDFITSHSDEELGFLTFRNNANGSHTSSPTGGPHAWDSVFDYIEEHSVRSPTFFNFMFSRDSMTTVLRPFSGIPSLEIWDFFLSEDLSKGSCYDFEAAEIDDPFSKKRRTVLAGYDCVDACSLSGFLQVLENLRTAQVKLGRLAQMWRNVWDKLEPPSNATLTVRAFVKSQAFLFSSDDLKADMVSAVQLQGRLLHKRATVDILLRGRLTNEISPGVGASVSGDSGHQVSFSHPHRFERCSYATPTYCDYCSRLLWGIVRQTGMKCMDCGYNAHERCVDTAPKNCQKVSPGTISVEVLPPEPETETIAPDEPSTVGISPGRHAASCPPESHGSVAEQEDGDDVRLSQSAAQSISVAYLQDLKALQPRGQDRAAGYYDGYLYKRGAKLKAWPKRWFVLDPMKHQLRYYHSKEDNHWKGLIDLDKVQSAVAVPPPSGLRGIPKGFDDNSFFDVVVTLQEGTRRVYNFCAFNGNAATTWIEKIQACLVWDPKVGAFILSSHVCEGRRYSIDVARGNLVVCGPQQNASRSPRPPSITTARRLSTWRRSRGLAPGLSVFIPPVRQRDISTAIHFSRYYDAPVIWSCNSPTTALGMGEWEACAEPTQSLLLWVGLVCRARGPVTGCERPNRGRGHRSADRRTAEA
ncbi:unnamed protein product [Notodromas monacha]|uniref:Uncharacterized protein n=1 Tax=Notodromas monacha TaxID=399045 RepID=A0A7R9BIC8_9CRUS|nr:unnamed protein product [Notodromas monacha]CAG0916072.1 unnamed protein product [Notodromas monacha]